MGVSGATLAILRLHPGASVSRAGVRGARTPPDPGALRPHTRLVAHYAACILYYRVCACVSRALASSARAAPRPAPQQWIS